ncbi:MAG TPA: Hsp20/alpha crystallin family protein [Saprospiraceae bacterium]|nr:Hsp20/alpha crystallin family protein [Saprospiraceae bacterium]
MKPYTARPILRTRFQNPMSAYMTHPCNYEWPVVKSRDLKATNPATNIVRMEAGYQIQIAVPGIPKNQIQIQVVEDQLVVSATNPNQETEKRFVRQEFDFSGFKRSFTLPKNADTENMKAGFENGILTITILDKEPETRKIEIQ